MRRDLRFTVLIREDSTPRRLESLTICRCDYKGSTFSSVILRPWVLVRPESNSRPPAWQPDVQPTEPPVRYDTVPLICCTTRHGEKRREKNKHAQRERERLRARENRRNIVYTNAVSFVTASFSMQYAFCLHHTDRHRCRNRVDLKKLPKVEHFQNDTASSVV